MGLPKLVTALSMSVAVWLVIESRNSTRLQYYYYPSGALHRISSVDRNGQLHGLSVTYFEDGTLKYEGVYDHGQWISHRYYSHGGDIHNEALVTADHGMICRYWNPIIAGEFHY
jgi:antitoxin component YwqK of YwqJK toxin-antitoxin module